MPQPSARADQMPSSPIRRLVEHAIAAEKRGIRVHYLNIGQPDVRSPDAFWEAITHSGIQVLEYSHSMGVAGLREVVARDYQRRGIPLDASQLMITTGGSEATGIAFLSCFDPGDEVIVVEPFYANYAGFAATAGVSLVPITTSIDEDYALPALSEFGSKVTARTRGILLCNPSNPTGAVYPESKLREIGDLARERDLFLLVDEVYRDFSYGEERPTSIISIPGLEQHAVLIDSASKKFSVCGARVGFLATKNPELLAGALKFAQTRLSSPTLDQLGVQACFEHTGESYFETVRAEYMRRRDVLVAELSAIPGVLVPKIEGAFYAVVRLPIDSGDRFCQWLLTDFEVEGETVLLAPASGFYLTPGLGEDEVRLAYVVDQESLRKAVRIIAAALQVYPGATANGQRTEDPLAATREPASR